MKTLSALRSLVIFTMTIGFSLSVGSVACAQFGQKDVAKQPHVSSDYDQLIKVITTMIAPDTWEEAGGFASIVSVDSWSVLIVSQTSTNHQKIEHLIRALRLAQAMQQGQADVEKSQPTSIPIIPESPIQKEINAALDTVTKVEYLETPLTDLVADLAQRHRIPVYIDRRNLDDDGIAGDTPVTANLNGLSLRSALTIMLRELDLTFVVTNEYLKITTANATEFERPTRVYLIKDLAIKKRASATPRPDVNGVNKLSILRSN